MGLRVLLALVLLLLTARGIIIDDDPRTLTCTEGLTDCHVSSEFMHNVPVLDLDESVEVTQVELNFILCCQTRQNCEPCLRITITVREVESSWNDEEGQRSEGSGQRVPPEPKVKVCRSSPGNGEFCKTLEFKPSDSGSRQAAQAQQLHLKETVFFGSPVVISVSHSKTTQHIRNITIPTLEEVCSMNLQVNVKDCEVPRIHVVKEPQRNVVRLQVENMMDRKEELMYQMVWNEIHGRALIWPVGEPVLDISSDVIVPCLCIQAWWERRGIRSETCPFRKHPGALERMLANVSVTVVEAQVMGEGLLLIWNVTAPCRLEAELQLCKRNPSGGACEEVTGSRLRLRADWRATRTGHWTSGTFNATAHPLLCVQIKVAGMQTFKEPLCPFRVTRWRWSLLLLVGLFLICLTALVAYFIQGVFKDYMCRWLTDSEVKGAVGGCHVILLYPPANDQTLCELVCHLGSSLQTLGFSVSLDLWSQRELSELGPVPWLHSRLDRLRRQGGKVVVVLSKAAWVRAEEWGAWERSTPREKRSSLDAGTSPCLDVFSASLSCILADYLQGRAGERFMLVQFESLPPEPPGGCKMIPELFRGLHVYSLPSQSLGFLTELAGARQTSTASARRKRAGGIRRASQALARSVSGFTAGGTMLRMAGMPQTCVGVGLEDAAESVPLQFVSVSTSSSSDSSP
ncbi:interleukin-17 receptor C isoform 1-T1 [Synchiropus picturatus]